MSIDSLPLIDLVTYLRAYSIMINAGVSLMRCMAVLTDQTVHEGLRGANVAVMQAVEQGSTLSKAMRDHPEVFTPFLIGLVRAGEVGGVLDETMARAADFYEKQLTLRRDRVLQQAAARTMGKATEQQYETAMLDAEQLTAMQYFCYMFGTMLAAGVPVVQALQVAAEVLPGPADEIVCAAAEQLRQREIDSLAASFQKAELPSEVVQMVAVGEECGCLDQMMLRAGDIVGVRIDGILLRALWEQPAIPSKRLSRPASARHLGRPMPDTIAPPQPKQT